MQQTGREHRAGRADRVAMRDSAALDIDVIPDRPRSLATAMAIAAKASLISIRSISPVLPAGAIQRLLHRRHRAHPNMPGSTAPTP